MDWHAIRSPRFDSAALADIASAADATVTKSSRTTNIDVVLRMLIPLK